MSDSGLVILGSGSAAFAAAIRAASAAPGSPWWSGAPWEAPA